MKERFKTVRDRLKAATQARLAEKPEISGGMSLEVMEMVSKSDTVGIDVSIPIGVDLQQFTEQQIDDYCEKVENKCLFIPLDQADGKLLFEGVKIIKQLQAEA